MRNCPNCKEEVPKEFDICWNCNYNFINSTILEVEDITPNGKKVKKINCLRCQTSMQFQRTREFYEGRGANHIDWFATKTILDFYVCPKCSKVEMFLPE